MSNESNSCETACAVTPPGAHRLASSHSAAQLPPPPLPTIADGVALAFPLAGPMGTRLHAAVTALIQHQQHPCKHLWDVVLKATSQRLAGSHGAQRGFFVPVAKDSPACTRARCFSPYIPAFFCPVHTRESLAAQPRI